MMGKLSVAPGDVRNIAMPRAIEPELIVSHFEIGVNGHCRGSCVVVMGQLGYDSLASENELLWSAVTS